MKLISTFKIALLLLIISSCGGTTTSESMEKDKKFNAMVVFGDGLSDMGRWGTLTDQKYPPAELGFYESRWTNGKVWVEHLADQLELPISFDNNFAMGGATTGTYNINEPLRQALQLNDEVTLTGMLGQVQAYLAEHPKADSQTLFILWAGGHDIGNYLDYGQPDLEQYPPAKNFKIAIDLLIRAGARYIFIGTMPDMGYTPAYYGTDKQQIASDLCAELNRGLKNIEDKYSDNAQVMIYRFDGAAVFSEIGMDPGKYGIEYVNEAYLPDDVINFMEPLQVSDAAIPNREEGLDPDKFMNWWAVSASARVHRVIGEKAFEFLK